MKEFPASHLLTLSGPPRQRGRIHGEALRGEIRAVLGGWKDFLAGSYKVSPDLFIQSLLEQTDFSAAIEKWTPDLMEETRGIAEGAGADFSDVFAFQLQDEQWWFGQDLKSRPPSADRCSSIGWRGETRRPGLVAQNMDLHQFLDGCQVVLRIQERPEEETLVFSAAGLLALNGMNRSVGIVCNNLGQLNHSRDGLPVAHVLRGVLRRRSFAEARAFLGGVQHASGQNYVLASRSQLVDLECSANQATEYLPPDGGRSLCHTNHPLINDDYQDRPDTATASREKRQEFRKKSELNSRTRFDVLAGQLAATGAGGLDRERARSLLSSHASEEHPVCRHPETNQGWMTVGTSIMTLGEAPELEVCPGPPCSSKFSRFAL